MPRKRYLKPGFFSNEDLADLPFEHRLVFQGLWLWADREGKLEDRPKRLKGNIMPYDNIDFEECFKLLEEKNFITRYDTIVNNKPFKAIWIITFTKHQDVHRNEQASIIPYPSLDGTKTYQGQAKDGIEPDQGQAKDCACTPCNLVLVTSNLELETCLVDDDNCARKIEINEAIEDFINPPEEEKEKNSAKKEKELPPVDFVMQKMEEFEFWRISIEHNLPTGLKWDKLIPAQKKIYQDERDDYFKIFWEQKTDNYRIRLPSWTEIVTHFYNWVPIHKTKDERKKLLNGNNTNHAAGGNAKHKAAGTRDERNSGVEDLISQSESFLQQYPD